MPTEYAKLYKARWQKQKSIIIAIRFNKEKDDDLLRWLETVPNKSQYIKNLIDADINKALKG